MPGLLSFLIDAPVMTCPLFSRLTVPLVQVPILRKPVGHRHPLQFVLALAVYAFTAAGHDSLSTIGD